MSQPPNPRQAADKLDHYGVTLHDPEDNEFCVA
jgi:hypothetical protein